MASTAPALDDNAASSAVFQFGTYLLAVMAAIALVRRVGVSACRGRQ